MNVKLFSLRYVFSATGVVRSAWPAWKPELQLAGDANHSKWWSLLRKLADRRLLSSHLLT